MRVIDLLSLISDYPKNARVRFLANERLENYVGYELETIDEADFLVLKTQVAGKPIKLWEFTVLLHRKENNQRFVAIKEENDTRPVFGMQEDSGQVVIR